MTPPACGFCPRVPLLKYVVSNFPLPLWGFTILLLGIFGCQPSGPRATQEDGDNFQRLSAIGSAYTQFMQEKGSPPQNKSDLMPFLQQSGHGSDVFVSSSGKEFMIFWGKKIDLSAAEPTVIAHDADSKGGRRMVATSIGAFRLSDDELEKENARKE